MSASIHPFISLWTIFRHFDRCSLKDIADAIGTPVLEDLPEGEITPGPIPRTPFENLTHWCFDNEVEFFDYRDLKKWPRRKDYDTKIYGWPRNKKRGHPYGSRDLRLRNTFMLHTTAAPGMKAERAVGMPVHCFVPKEEALVLSHNVETLMAHGHAGNKFSYGCEVSGMSNWDHESQIARCRQQILYFKAYREAKLRADYDKEGKELKHFIFPHRFAHNSRRRDCGMQIWEQAGAWAIEEHGFHLGPVVGSGKALPPAGEDW